MSSSTTGRLRQLTRAKVSLGLAAVAVAVALITVVLVVTGHAIAGFTVGVCSLLGLVAIHGVLAQQRSLREQAARNRIMTDIAKLEKLITRSEWQTGRHFDAAMKLIAEQSTVAQVNGLSSRLRVMDGEILRLRRDSRSSHLTEGDVERLLLDLAARSSDHLHRDDT